MADSSPECAAKRQSTNQSEFMGSRLDGDHGCGKITRRAKFRLTRRANKRYQLARLTPKEGRIAIVTNAGWDAVDATASGEQVNCRAYSGLSQTRERSNGAQT